MSSPDLSQSDSRALARLLAAGAEPHRLWTPQELRAVLEHQMASAVQFDLGGLGSELGAKLSGLAASEGLLIRSFHDLLHHPHPPMELLVLTKQFAKACVDHPDSPLPSEVARVLYFACIIVAKVRHGARITELDDEALRHGVHWALSQPWLDDATRVLFTEGQAALGA